MTNLFENKTAIVTGAGRGIGKAIAQMLADSGATIYAAARSMDQLEALAEQYASGQIIPVKTDLEKESDILSLFDKIQKDGRKLDILVNNAGLGIYAPVAEMTTENFDRVISVNLRGSFICSREALKLMQPQREGYIINISSVVGIKGYPNQGAYTASKHGLMGLTKTLAVEAADYDIRVSAILPGGVDTEMVTRARPDLDTSILIRPEDIANTVMYMLNLSPSAHVDQIYIRRRTAQPF